MPTARETLLAAAHTAAGAQPWAGVRMVDVAAAAGVSRQTLYNEFGSKEGLGAALVNRLVDGFLDGAVRAAAEVGRGGADPAASCAAAAAWMLRTARDEPIVRAALTGCWGPRMPLVATAGTPRSWAGPGDPAELTTVLCHRLVAGLSANRPSRNGPGLNGPARHGPARHGPSRHGSSPNGPSGNVQVANGPFGNGPLANGQSGKLSRACEAGLRIALSYVVAPSVQRQDDEAVGRIREVVRALLAPSR